MDKNLYIEILWKYVTSVSVQNAVQNGSLDWYFALSIVKWTQLHVLTALGRLFFQVMSSALFVVKYWCKKGKAVPLQAWTGPEGSRKLRFPDFVTTAQDGGIEFETLPFPRGCEELCVSVV
jgi:hypothetical protein